MDRFEIWDLLYYEQLAHTVMEAKKSHNVAAADLVSGESHFLMDGRLFAIMSHSRRGALAL